MGSTTTGMLASKTVLIKGTAVGIGWASALLFGREGARAALADLLGWLPSDRSSYATGSAYEVDGGFMAG